MNRDDIIRMARESGLEAYSILPHKEIDWDCLVDDLATFAHLVYEATFRDANIAASRTILDAAVLEEREACAKLAEETVCATHLPTGVNIYGSRVAKAIRERSNP